MDVEIFQFYNTNLLLYPEVNNVEGGDELDVVSKIVVPNTVALSGLNPTASGLAWQRYALDLKDLIHQDPGAIYQVRLAFRHGYAL